MNVFRWSILAVPFLAFGAAMIFISLPIPAQGDPPPRFFNGQEVQPDEPGTKGSEAVTPVAGKKLVVKQEFRLKDRFAGNKLVFSPDGSLLIRLAGWEVSIWDLSGNEPKEVSVISTRDRHMQSVDSAAFSPDGSLLALGGGDKSVRLFSCDHSGTITELSAATEHDASVQCLQFNSQGNLLVSGGDDMALILWTVDKGQLEQVGIFKMEHAIFGIKHISFFPKKNTFFVTCGDGTVCTMDIVDNDFKPQATTKLPADFTLPVAVSPAGDRAVFGSKNDVRLWDRQSKQTFLGHTGKVVSVAWSPDGKEFASVGEDGQLLVWSADGKVRYRLLRPSKFNWVAFTKVKNQGDVCQLACANDNGTIFLISLGESSKAAPADPAPPAQKTDTAPAFPTGFILKALSISHLPA